MPTGGNTLKKDHPVRWDYHRKGVRRWIDARGELVDNELTIDTLEYVYDLCWASWQYKVDVGYIEECVVLGDVVYSAEEGVVISRFMIPFWSLPIPTSSELLGHIRDIGEAFQKMAAAFAIPTKMLEDFDSSVYAAYDAAFPNFYGFYRKFTLDDRLRMPTAEQLAELKREMDWLNSPWRTPEDLSWLSPDGGEYEQRYRNGKS